MLIEEAGAEVLTMGAVADRAGVTRRSVYLHFDSRADLLGALFDHVSRVEGLADSLAAVDSARDADTALQEWANHVARYHPRVLTVDLATSVFRGDPDLARHRAKVEAGQKAACHGVASRIATERRLAQPWTADTAAEFLWAHLAPDMLDRLFNRCGWSHEQAADYLGVSFARSLLIDRRT